MLPIMVEIAQQELIDEVLATLDRGERVNWKDIEKKLGDMTIPFAPPERRKQMWDWLQYKTIPKLKRVAREHRKGQ